jgi:signal transduction histidine kinase
MFKRSIIKKLMFLYFIVGLSSLSFIGFYSYFKAKNALIERAFEQLKSIRSIKQIEIENYFSDHKSDSNKYNISYHEIDNILSDTNKTSGLGKSGEIYLVDENFQLLTKSRFLHKDSIPVKVLTKSVRRAFRYGRGNGICDDYRSVLSLNSFSKLNIKGLNWVIIAEIDYKEAIIPITILRNDLLFVSLIILILIFSIAQVISNDIVNPILKLKNAAVSIGQGDLDTKLELNAENEFGVLASTFNQMTADIRKNTSELVSERTKRISALYDGQEFERQRISRDLHDGLAQHLIAVKMSLENLIRRKEFDDDKKINDLNRQIVNSIEELRKISYDLAPASLMDFSLEGSIENLCIQVQKNSDIQIDFSFYGDFSGLDKRSKIYLYRIVQEALNNTLKHADATKVDIQITETRDHFVLMIEDNGKGFDFDNKELGLGKGLFNIRERSIMLNGTFDVESFPGKGTTIRIKIDKMFKNGEN